MLMVGRPKRVSDKEILQEIALARGPVVTAGELAEKLEMNQSGVYKRLNDLVDQGLVKERKVGASAKVYWLSEDGREYLD